MLQRENGIVDEDIDVRREEREACDRARRDQRRACKSSRGSNTIDRLSVHSGDAASLRPQTDSLSGPLSPPLQCQDRKHGLGIPRASSQYSLAESSSSPRHSRFLGLSMPFGRSRNSLALSGMSASTIDTQCVASPRCAETDRSSGVRRVSIQDQSARATEATHGSAMPSRYWAALLLEDKAKRGATQSGASRSVSDRARLMPHEDDVPLAPPPPLAYLVKCGGGDGGGGPSSPREREHAPSTLASPRQAGTPRTLTHLHLSPASVPAGRVGARGHARPGRASTTACPRTPPTDEHGRPWSYFDTELPPPPMPDAR
jgi:hypothetical protein